LEVSVLERWRYGLLKHLEHLIFLQEILTVKSDDVVGRAKAYEAIVKGDPMPEPGIPESFQRIVTRVKRIRV
jgi:DNA-directed RNA polymerase beta subunit